jgi:DNA-directed RNA polymerase subunit RPC12/RpoP
MAKKLVVDSNKVTLVYVCPECKTEYHQLAWEVVENGTGVCCTDDCPNQDDDCILERVEIETD